MRGSPALAILLLAILGAPLAHARSEPPVNPYPGYVSATYSDPTKWLCRPDTDDVCDHDLDATVVRANGRTTVKRLRAPRRSFRP